MPKRYDRATLKGAKVDAWGFLHAPAVITRTGVLIYRRADGSISRELKHPDDVFDPESIESAKRLPITDGHPSEFVDAKNDAKLTKGTTGDAWERRELDGGESGPEFMATVRDGALVSKIQSKGSEVSVGYTVDIVDESGVYNGQPYDRRHKNIRYNHLARVDRGRGGSQVRMRLDGDDAVIEDENTNEGTSKMATLRIDDAQIEIPDASVTIVQTALKDRDDKLAASEKARQDAEAERDRERGRADAADKKAKEAAAGEPGSVRDAVDVIDSAGAILGDAWTKKGDDGKSPRDKCLDAKPGDIAPAVRRAVVLTKCADEADALKDASDEYIRARFDGLKKDAAASPPRDGRRQDAAALLGGRNADSVTRLTDSLTKTLHSDPLEAAAL